ncbi:DNA utilization family protein [Serratia grimesii]|uniref:DUF2531 family protein n=1 Tax=Serratia grimesii TaxID=82995 RepID=A0ABR4U3B0_9GAMM|nr:hypothetical protein CR62_19975 [Serratia grimesii]
MNKRSGYWLLLLPLGLMAQPRDPFSPLPIPGCVSATESLVGWKLKGTLGQGALRHAWVITPTGQWLRLASHQTLLAGRWQVEQVQAKRLMLKREEGDGDTECPAAENTAVLVLGTHHKEEKE